MSVEAIRAVRNLRVGSASWKAVLFVIADEQRKDGTPCRLRYGAIAAHAECDVRTVKRAVPSLIKEGVLEGKSGALRVSLAGDTMSLSEEGDTMSPGTPCPQSSDTMSPNGDTMSPLKEPGVPEDQTRSPNDDPKNDPEYRFEDFWLAYPRRHGVRVGKKEALVLWRKMSYAEKSVAWQAVKHYATHCETTGTLAKDAERWLRHRRWEEWLDGPGEPQSTNGKAHAGADTAHWWDP